MSLFSTKLHAWYAHNKRDLPWRNTSNAYYIWLSEVILQQTRVQQGMSYYYKFVNRFPDIESMALAEENEVLNLWQGLGYYSRARNMHKTARYVFEELGGVFPNKFDKLLELPGVGRYTASAIASFAYDLPYAVVDGNVYRVLSRYLNVDEYIDTGSGQKLFQQLADELLDKSNPAHHNQAVMELGALVCTPKKPKCDDCPLQASCVSFAEHTFTELPRKKGKVKVKSRTLNYFTFLRDDRVYLRKRGDKDIWANMFEFPLLEGDHVPVELLDVVEFSKNTNHKLTHQNLNVNFYQLKLSDFPHHVFENCIEVHIEDLKNYPLPRVIEKYLSEELGLDVRI